MDKTDFLFLLIDKANALYDEIVDSEFFDPEEVRDAVDLLQKFIEELETLVE